MGGIIGLSFAAYSILLTGLVFLGYFKQRRKEDQRKHSLDRVLLDELTVIVPFRNEANRIAVLLESINKSCSLPHTTLFVDDHSSDDTADVIEEKLQTDCFRLLRLPSGVEGKKQAIREAMKEVRTKWVLSMDADVEFAATYFQELEKLGDADAFILPVKMKSEHWFHRLFELDVLLINAVNAGINGWSRPIIASGANLLYSKEAFEIHDRFEEHRHMPSGDDIYLLRDFRNGGAKVALSTNPALAIVTETPQSFREFIHQRLRWIAKTGDVGDHLSTFLSVLQASFTFFFFGLFIHLLIASQFSLALITLLIKTCVDLLVFFPYFKRMQRIKSWLFLPLYELFFPLYSLLILALMYTYKPVWKGRKLSRNF